MKTKYIIALAAGALALAGCQREELAGGDSENFGDGQIRYSVATVGLKSSAPETRSAGSLTLVSKDGKLSVPVTCEVSDDINHPGNTSATKGALINTTGIDGTLPESSTFTVSAYRGSAAQFTGKTASKSGAYWTMDPPQYWPLSTKLTFYAYANAGSNTVNQTATSQTLEYNVAANAESHKDLMLGYYKGNGGNKGIAEIHFDHPLTAVRFKKGNMPGITGIKIITISGLASGGSVTMDEEGAIGDWTVSDTEYTTVVTLSGGESTLGIDETSKLIGLDSEKNYNGAFLLVPQALADHKATVTVVLATASGDVTVSADIASGSWKVGKTNTYTLGYTELPQELLPGKFSISETEYVQFSRGNLFCTRSGDEGSYEYKFDFERNQYDYRCRYGKTNDKAVIGGAETTTPESTSGLFQWIPRTSQYAAADWGAFSAHNNGLSDDKDNDVLNFGDVFPGDVWKTLTIGQWQYLVNNHTVKIITVNGVKGLCIAPDNYDGEISSSYTSEQWNVEEEKGMVFLPYYGYYNSGTGFDRIYTDHAGYWSSTPDNSGQQNYQHWAQALHFHNNGNSYLFDARWRTYGQNVRLVQRFFKPHEYIDLDLPSGTLWATNNVGADSPEEYGDYFQWGGVTPVTSTSINVSWATCPGNGGSSTYDGSAFTTWRAENLTDDVLKLTVDAACANWGRDWRMPTSDEFKELCDNTNNQWIEENGVMGWKFTSKMDSSKYIFLPAAGSRYGTESYDAGSYGLYWTSSLYSTELEKAYYLSFGSSTDVDPQLPAWRVGGCPVRPVRPVHD